MPCNVHIFTSFTSSPPPDYQLKSDLSYYFVVIDKTWVSSISVKCYILKPEPNSYLKQGSDGHKLRDDDQVGR